MPRLKRNLVPCAHKWASQIPPSYPHVAKFSRHCNPFSGARTFSFPLSESWIRLKFPSTRAKSEFASVVLRSISDEVQSHQISGLNSNNSLQILHSGSAVRRMFHRTVENDSNEFVSRKLLYHFNRYTDSFTTKASHDKQQTVPDKLIQGIFPSISSHIGSRLRVFTIQDIQRSRHRVKRWCHPHWYNYRQWYKRLRARISKAKSSLHTASVKSHSIND